MRIYSDDLVAIKQVTEFLENFQEPEGFYLHVAVHTAESKEIGVWEYDTENWVFVTKD